MPKFLLICLFKYAIEPDSIYKKEWKARSAEAPSKDFSPEVRWPHIKPLVASPQVTSFNSRRNLEIPSSKPRSLFTRSVLNKLNETDAVSIQIAHLVHQHQMSQSTVDLHHWNRLSAEAGSQLEVPHDSRSEQCIGIFLHVTSFKIFSLPYLLI